MRRTIAILSLGAALGMAACLERSRVPLSSTTGAQPQLPAPESRLVPTIHIASAEGWPAGKTPVSPQGLGVTAFATQLDHPRWIYVLPDGDVLVAETAAPERPQDNRGFKGWVMRLFMKDAGSAVPSANRITLLRDRDGDGRAETRSQFLGGLYSPFGMALVGSDLYVADSDAILRFHYDDGADRIEGPGVRLTDLPAGPINHHWTKNIVASRDGTRLYATVGSNSNVAENGIAAEEGRAAIYEVDTKTGSKRLFATGLRNPNGMAWEPATGTLWTVVNERDELGNDLVPDYLTSVREGGFYGWPYCYYGSHVDKRVKPERPDLVERAIPPDYSLGSHVAALGLTFANGTSLPARFSNGAFVGQHGSWNRRPRSGYNVVFVPFHDGQPAGEPIEILSGFVSEEGSAYGRPVGVALDKRGALLVADDVGNSVWRVGT